MFEGEQITYDGLNQRANQLANYLRALGVGPDVLVATWLDRSAEAVVALLGILKAGGAYVPLDTAYPKERLAFVLEDAQIPVLLTQQRLLANLPIQNPKPVLSKAEGSEIQNPVVVCLDTDWGRMDLESDRNSQSGVTADNLAYVIYTSGSTGGPKGVAVSHRSICNRLLWGQEFYGITAADRILHAMSLSFDFATWEIFTALAGGAQLVLAHPERHQDGAYLVRLIAEQNITVAGFVPSMLEALLQQSGIERCRSLRKVMSGAEALSSSLQDLFHACLDAELQNTYGPTEAAIDVAYWVCKRDVESGGNRQSVPIGRPIANTQIYILDSDLQPVPIGVSGELHIGGAGLARGYLRRPDLTAEKFIPNPFSPVLSEVEGDEPGSRLYKTGDLARYLPDGNIDFLGRIDYQVKIRGFRIELGEIEAVLGQHPAVREAVVVSREDAPGDSSAPLRTGKRLVAYVVAKQQQPFTVSDLRGFLKKKLPDYMVPSAFVTLDALPLTTHGKVDRRAFPEPDQTRPGLAGTYVAPRTAVEEALTGIWAEVLGLERVGINDDFFEFGGHSLLMVQLISRIRQTFQADVPLLRLYQSPTVAGFAEAIAERCSEGEKAGGSVFSCLVPLRDQGDRVPLFCVSGAKGYVNVFHEFALHLGAEQPVYGLEPPGLDGQREPLGSIEALAEEFIRHIRLIQPEGPYCLFGLCFGGRVVYEIARQLTAQGQRVAVLAMLDTAAPGAFQRPSWPKRSLLYARDFWQMDSRKKTKFLRARYSRFRQWLGYQNETEAGSNGSEGLDAGQVVLRKVIAANVQASRRYDVKPYPGRVLLFRGTKGSKRSRHCTVDPLYGWGKVTGGRVEMHVIKGHHEKILREPKVHRLVKVLDEYLFEVQTTGPLKKPFRMESEFKVS
jgi:amino acid adenylation domain-containing protein